MDANEISGTWSASRLDGTVLEKLIEPKLTGEEPLDAWRKMMGRFGRWVDLMNSWVDACLWWLMVVNVVQCSMLDWWLMMVSFFF